MTEVLWQSRGEQISHPQLTDQQHRGVGAIHEKLQSPSGPSQLGWGFFKGKAKGTSWTDWAKHMAALPDVIGTPKWA